MSKDFFKYWVPRIIVVFATLAFILSYPNIGIRFIGGEPALLRDIFNITIYNSGTQICFKVQNNAQALIPQGVPGLSVPTNNMIINLFANDNINNTSCSDCYYNRALQPLYPQNSDGICMRVTYLEQKNITFDIIANWDSFIHRTQSYRFYCERIIGYTTQGTYECNKLY